MKPTSFLNSSLFLTDSFSKLSDFANMVFMFIFTFFLTFSTFAANWNDLSAGKTYKLTQNFQLKQTERSGSLLDFTKGQSASLKEIHSLSSINVVLYVFAYPQCDMKTEMEIIPVEGSQVEFGAQVEDCHLNVYLESPDQWTPSIFE